MRKQQYLTVLDIYSEYPEGKKFYSKDLLNDYERIYKKAPSRSLTSLVLKLLAETQVVLRTRTTKEINGKLKSVFLYTKYDNIAEKDFEKILKKQFSKYKKSSKVPSKIFTPPVEEEETEDYDVKLSFKDFFRMKNEILSLAASLKESQKEVRELLDENTKLKGENQILRAKKDDQAKHVDMSWLGRLSV